MKTFFTILRMIGTQGTLGVLLYFWVFMLGLGSAVFKHFQYPVFSGFFVISALITGVFGFPAVMVLDTNDIQEWIDHLEQTWNER